MPLHLALDGKFLYCAKLSIDNGTSVDIRDSSGITPYDRLKELEALWIIDTQGPLISTYLDTIVEARVTDEDAITPGGMEI